MKHFEIFNHFEGQKVGLLCILQNIPNQILYSQFETKKYSNNDLTIVSPLSYYLPALV